MFVSASRPGLGLVLGLGLVSFSCTGEGTGSTVADTADSADSLDTNEADAVTYAGPDSWESSDTYVPPPDTTSSSTTLDPADSSDAVTYAGPDESTTIGDATTSTGTTGETTGTTGETSSTDDGEPCVPITEDASGIGVACEVDGDCLPGYTCQPFQGIVQQLSCQVRCEQTCECPAGLACLEVADKSGASWFQCG